MGGVEFPDDTLGGWSIAKMLRKKIREEGKCKQIVVSSCFGARVARVCDKELGEEGKDIEKVGPEKECQYMEGGVDSRGKIEWAFFGRDGLRPIEVPTLRIRAIR